MNLPWLTFHDWTQPSAQASTQVVQENAAGQMLLSASDPDPGQQLTFSIVTQPSHGTVATDGGASATYAPEPGYAGADTFTFRAFDGWKNSSVATVTIKVNAPPVDDAGLDVTVPWGVPLTLGGTAADVLPLHRDPPSWSFGDGSRAREQLDDCRDPGAHSAPQRRPD